MHVCMCELVRVPAACAGATRWSICPCIHPHASLCVFCSVLALRVPLANRDSLRGNFAALHGLTRLVQLSITHISSRLEGAQMQQYLGALHALLESLTGLTSLALDDHRREPFSMECLSRLQCLQALSLANMKIADLHFLGSLTQLSNLSLVGNCLLELPDLSPLTRLCRLRVILQDPGFALPAHVDLAGLPRLSRLTLHPQQRQHRWSQDSYATIEDIRQQAERLSRPSIASYVDLNLQWGPQGVATFSLKRARKEFLWESSLAEDVYG